VRAEHPGHRYFDLLVLLRKSARLYNCLSL
jgi:hypothetical protein